MDDHDLTGHPIIRAFVPKPVHHKHKQFEGMVVWIQLPVDPADRSLLYEITDKIRVRDHLRLL